MEFCSGTAFDWFNFIGVMGATLRDLAVVNRASKLSRPWRASIPTPTTTPRLQRPTAAPLHWPAITPQAAVGQRRFAAARRRCGGIRYIHPGSRLSC